MADPWTRMVRSLMEPIAQTYQPAFWQPPTDIYRTPSGWLVKFDLAGVRPEDIELEVSGCDLTVRGIRRDWAIEEAAHSYSMEISYNRFQRSIRLPCEVEHARVAWEYRDGMLLVRLTTEREP